MRIDVQAVSKRFGDFTALEAVTLQVPEDRSPRCSGRAARASRRCCGSSPA